VRVLVGVDGQAGHALPALRLARELAARGHEVRVHTTARWRDVAEEAGAEFAGAEDGLAPGLRGDAGYPEVARVLAESARELGADVVVGDGLTLTPGLAAEVAGVRLATLFPEVFPFTAPGMPYFSLGLLPPRTPIGRLGWRALAPALETRLPTTRWLSWSRAALNEVRAELSLPPRSGRHGPASDGMTLVATLPELEYPRRWPADVHVTGPMLLDIPQPDLELPAGPEPLVLVAPSTVKDPEGDLVRTALGALADEPVRVVASTSGGPRPHDVPPNSTVADWIDYSKAMPAASVVISNGTHGTIVQALTLGVPLALFPALPDDAEHGARVTWTGAGLSTTRRPASPSTLRAVVRRVLADPGFAERARRIAAAGGALDGAARGADLVEAYAL
jgi:UDP:flavonoid glycosyltransferase YjiC (YdhE family)